MCRSHYFGNDVELQDVLVVGFGDAGTSGVTDERNNSHKMCTGPNCTAAKHKLRCVWRSIEEKKSPWQTQNLHKAKTQYRPIPMQR